MSLSRIFCFLVLFCFQTTLFSQSPYTIDWKTEPIYLGLGIGTLGLGAYLHAKTPLFTTDELITFDRADVNAFDRPATYNNSLKAHELSNVLWYGSQIAPVLLLTGKAIRSDFGKIALLYGEMAFINGGLTALAKSTFKRPRPYVFNENVDEGLKMSGSARAAFISGHTSITAANTFFIAKVFSDYYPDSKWKPYIWSAAVIIPAVTGYLRVEAGKHYPTDVIAGYAVGASVGFLVPHLHKRKDHKKLEGLSFYPSMNGALFRLQF